MFQQWKLWMDFPQFIGLLRNRFAKLSTCFILCFSALVSSLCACNNTGSSPWAPTRRSKAVPCRFTKRFKIRFSSLSSYMSKKNIRAYGSWNMNHNSLTYKELEVYNNWVTNTTNLQTLHHWDNFTIYSLYLFMKETVTVTRIWKQFKVV